MNKIRSDLILKLEAEYGSASKAFVDDLENMIHRLNNISYQHGHDDAKREGKAPNVVDLFGARDIDNSGR